MTSRYNIPFIKIDQPLSFQQADIDAWLQEGKRISTKNIENTAPKHYYKNGRGYSFA
ncbi:hypothetical protein [Bizionia gelidisalsuginis]|uniref:hypothetical protein n=1 Tax=Bizionia gelidisalsuginis TaxID=291188 RepID=UPI001478F58D|nr:hypothetical protein [Bizionia gelidisalsuginis]